MIHQGYPLPRGVFPREVAAALGASLREFVDRLVAVRAGDRVVGILVGIRLVGYSESSRSASLSSQYPNVPTPFDPTANRKGRGLRLSIRGRRPSCRRAGHDQILARST